MNVMKKIGSLFLILVLFLSVGTVYAKADSGNREIDFYVETILPENQIDKKQTYFDLKVSSGQQQDLEIKVTNKSGKDINVSVKAVTASTNRNGLVDYQTPDIKDETLEVAFAEIAEVREPVIHIPAGSTKTAVVTVRMPAEIFDGVVLGGLVFTKVPEQTDEAESGYMIRNVYNYVVGVKLSETDTPVLPEMELLGAGAELIDHRVAIVNRVRNENAAIVKNAVMDIKVFKDGASSPFVEESKTDVNMAPNSVLEYAIRWPGGFAEPGKYKSIVHVEHEGKEWDFEYEFEVLGNTAKEINNQSVDEQMQTGVPVWIIVLVAVLVLIIVALIILLLLFGKRNKKDNYRFTNN